MLCAKCGSELPRGSSQCPRCSVSADTGGSARFEQGPLQPGQPFGPRYRVLRLLGAGGMGSVYQAWDAELSVAVAIKVIPPDATADPTAAATIERRFKRELLLARQVTHKNVVRIHDLGEIDGVKYITMPYVEGADLATTLRHAGALKPARALRIARGIVAGLVAAHKAGVVHRDLKPANIMIGGDGEPVIMDFGIARSTGAAPAAAPSTTLAGTTISPTGPLSPPTGTARTPVVPEMTAFGAVMGTVEYMAPEQAKGLPADQRADVYAFGLILFDMLAGSQRATNSDDAIAELRARMQHAPPSVKTVVADVPEPLARLVSRCLEPDPEKRFQTSEALQAELDRLDDTGRTRFVRRSISVRAAAAAIVLLAAALGGAWWYVGPRPPEKPHDPVSILIADFQNKTGDPNFDGTLEPALGISVEGASFITTYRRDQARDVATQINAGSGLDPSAALLVSRREGIKVVLTGAVEPKGSGYSIAVQALDSANGKALGSAAASASSKGDVLKALAPIAAKIRAVLGDTTPESEKLAAAETVTASSFDALHAYERGQELSRSNKLEEALVAYKQAIALDPAMGRAYAGMAVVYDDLKDSAKTKAAYDEALKRVDRMTEREKYRTLGTYYLLVARNYDKAIENYEALLRRYPADSAAHGNLGMAYMLTGSPDRAVSEAREVLKIYPNNLRQRRNLALYLMYSGDFKSAIAEGARTISETPAYALGYLPVALSTLAAGDFDGAVKAYDRLDASGPAGVRLARIGRADMAMFRGRYAEAQRIGAVTGSAPPGTPASVAQLLVVEAQAALALGQKARAVDAASKAAGAATHESVLFPAALVLIEAGRDAEAKKIAQTLENALQAQTTAYARIITAQILARDGHVAEATEEFRDSIKRHDTWFARYLLGRVYMDAAHFPEAMAEFDLAMKRRGEATDAFFSDVPTLRYLPPLYYWLARAQEAVGVSEARRNYEQYVLLRGDADPADPLATDARARLSTNSRQRAAR